VGFAYSKQVTQIAVVELKISDENFKQFLKKSQFVNENYPKQVPIPQENVALLEFNTLSCDKPCRIQNKTNILKIFTQFFPYLSLY